VATPAFNPSPGRFTDSVSVALATPTPAATIRYTTDETEPTAGSGFTYTAPVTITGTATLKARAFRSGFRESAVASAVYTRLVPAMTVGLHSRIGVDTLLGGMIELRRDEHA
jgi:hypothetical protein